MIHLLAQENEFHVTFTPTSTMKSDATDKHKIRRLFGNQTEFMS